MRIPLTEGGARFLYAPEDFRGMKPDEQTADFRRIAEWGRKPGDWAARWTDGGKVSRRLDIPFAAGVRALFPDWIPGYRECDTLGVSAYNDASGAWACFVFRKGRYVVFGVRTRMTLNQLVTLFLASDLKELPAALVQKATWMTLHESADAGPRWFLDLRDMAGFGKEDIKAFCDEVESLPSEGDGAPHITLRHPKVVPFVKDVLKYDLGKFLAWQSKGKYSDGSGPELQTAYPALLTSRCWIVVFFPDAVPGTNSQAYRVYDMYPIELWQFATMVGKMHQARIPGWDSLPRVAVENIIKYEKMRF